MAIITDYARMCKAHEDCSGCPLLSADNGRGVVCNVLLRKYPAEA